MFEAEVKKLSNPMVLKPIDRVDYEFAMANAVPTTMFTVEKLANRVSFQRSIEAIADLVATAVDGSCGKTSPAIEVRERSSP